MSVFRKIAIAVVLASYLFANTVASSFHDHGDCCGQTAGAQDRQTSCNSKSDHEQGTGQHCCHHHHRHGPQQPAVGCQTAAQKQLVGGKPGSHPCSHEHKGGRSHDAHHCVVCDFLALAPLAAPQVALVPAGEILPEVVVADVLPVSSATIDTHLARGPPAA